MFFLDKKWVNIGVARQECGNDTFMLMHSGAAPRASVEVFQGQTTPAAAGKELLGRTKHREKSTSLRSHLGKKEMAVSLLPAVPWLAERQHLQILQVPKQIISQLHCATAVRNDSSIPFPTPFLAASVAFLSSLLSFHCCH